MTALIIAQPVILYYLDDHILGDGLCLGNCLRLTMLFSKRSRPHWRPCKVIRVIEADLIPFRIRKYPELVMELTLIQLVARQCQFEIKKAIRHKPGKSRKCCFV